MEQHKKQVYYLINLKYKCNLTSWYPFSLHIHTL